MKKGSEQEKLKHTFEGIKYELFIIIGSILTSYTYSWLDNKVIHEQLIIVMLRVFIAFADLGIFLAIGHLIDFGRGIWVFYIYKILSILEMDKDKIETEWHFVYETVGLPVCLLVYYKVTLFLLIYTASHIVQMQHEESIEENIKNEQEEHKINKMNEEEDGEKLFSRNERKQLYGEEEIKREEQEQEVNKTIRRIKLSLRYHKENEFYKKLEVFYFIIYNSTCLMVLFPLQEHVLDFTKGVGYKISNEKDLLLSNTMVLDAANDELRWVIDALTVMNVIGYWGIVMIGEFWIKTRYPELVKEYISKIPLKFLLLQLMSFAVMIIFLVTTPLINNNEGQYESKSQEIMLISLINPWLFVSCYLIHSVIPLIIIFLLYRLYLGLIYSLNHMVSTRFSYHQSSHDEEETNLDSVLYESITLNDINKVRHFIISPAELLPRHKLKRYTEQEKLKHYVEEKTVIEIQQMFEDFFVLDLYNKLSRWLAVWIFYLLLIVFVIGMTINDSHLLTEDKFFIHVPVVLLIIGFLIVNKYSSQPNIFYPKYILWLNDKYNQFLARNKAYHFIRMNHFYAILFGIWLYRLYAYMFLSTHQSVEEEIKLRLYEYYTDDSIMENWLFKKLLYGWAKYFMTHTAECDYDLSNVLIDTFMVILIIAQLLMQKKFVDVKKEVKKDPILLFLKLVTPLYAFYIFVIEMECLEWSRVVFCAALCVGVMFIHLNWTELERGIKRNEEGEFDD